MAETATHAGRLERENEELHQENARLRAALEELQLKLDEPEEVIRAIRRGEVDAVVVQEDGEEELYALHRFDAAYRMMVEECFPYGVWLAEPDGNLRYVSPSFLELLEADLPELRAKGQFHFLPPGVREEVEREWDRCRNTGRPFNREYTIRLKDGQERIIWTQGLLADTPDGRRHWVGVNIDITEQVSTAAALRASEERLRTIFDNTPMVLYLLDRDNRFLHINRTWEAAFGLTNERVAGRSIDEFFPPEIAQRFCENNRRVLESRSPTEFEEIVPHADGPHTYISVKVPICDATGAPYAVCGISTDITDRIKAQEELRKKNERLTLLSEAAAALLHVDDPDRMLHSLVEKIGPHFGLDGYFHYLVNETGDALRLESCLGIPEETARSISRLEFGQAICGAAALHKQPIVATHVQQSDDPRAELVKSLGIRAYVCHPLLAGDRLLGTLSFTSRTRDDLDDEELEFLRTISHYLTISYERVRLIRQLQDADRRKDEFLATLAHELRNPLAPICTGLEVLKLTGADRQSVADILETMERQTAQIMCLIDDLLDVSRITQGKLQIRKGRVQLAEIVQMSVEASRPSIDEARHELTIALPQQPIVLDVDPHRLAQVFSNLLNNAAKYTPPGGRITLSAETEASEVVVKVQDTGQGIPAEMQRRIFEMFAQADRSLEQGYTGLGIGLTLVKRLVEMHGGAVEVHSDGPGKGSEFRVRLPILAETDSHRAG